MADGGTMVPVTGLWLKKTKDGRSYFSGNINRGCVVLVFKNERKEKDSDPDYRLYFAQAANEGGDGGGRRNRDGGNGGGGNGGGRRRFNDRGGNGGGGEASPPGNADADDRDFS